MKTQKHKHTIVIKDYARFIRYCARKLQMTEQELIYLINTPAL